MKAIDKNLFEAALDLGAGWWTTARRVLLPLIAPGIFVALLLVYIPLFTDFASPTLVGGTSGYMLGQVVNDLVLESGDLNGGAAVSLLMLVASAIFAVVAYRLAKIRQLEIVSATNGGGQYDAVIVGGGHNGLVAAHYLATAGLRVIVCERREIVGGCCVTEEFAPGFRASTGAYVLSMLREPVWRDLRLVERGIEVDPAGPSLNLFADGSHLHLDDDLASDPGASCGASRAADARALPEFEAELGRSRRADHAADRHDAAGPARGSGRASSAGWRARRPARRATAAGSPTRCSCSAPRRPSTSPSTSRASRCARRSAGTRSTTRPAARRRPGPRSCCCTTTPPSRPAAGSASGASSAAGSAGSPRRWPTRRARPGRRSAPGRRSSGSWSRTAAPRASRSPSGERGARRAGALERRPEDDVPAPGRRTARCRTASAAASRAYRCEGTSMKINLAVDRLPGRGGRRRRRGPAVSPRDHGDQPDGRRDGRRRRPRRAPGARRPTRTSSSASPPSTTRRSPPTASHVVTIDVNSQPYTLAEGSWDELRDEVADRAIAKLEGYFPGLERLDRRAPGARPDRPRVAARDLGRPRAARRDGLRPALQPAPGARLGRLPDSGPRPVALRCRHPPRRRRHRRQRPQLRPRGHPRPSRPGGDASARARR